MGRRGEATRELLPINADGMYDVPATAGQGRADELRGNADDMIPFSNGKNDERK